MPDHAQDGHSAGACVARALRADEHARWDAFVDTAPDATIFHRAAWRGIVEGLGHRSHYLCAERDGVLVGVLPLVEIRSRLFGHSLISTPFCVYGGALAVDAASADCLRDAAVTLAEALGVDQLELREREVRHPGWPVKDLYVSFRKALHADDDANLKAIPRKQRAMVRKGIAAGLEARHDDSIDEFFAVYSESVRNLGTPVLPRAHYARVQQAFGDDCEITVVRHQGQPVAAVLSLYFRDEVHPYYGGSAWRGRDLAANDFMYWSVMQRAVQRGARVFDYGRSKQDSGSYHFKKHWGFEPQPLPYAYHLVRAREVPNVSPTNRKYALLIDAWKRLPLPVSRVLGPWLAKDLG